MYGIGDRYTRFETSPFELPETISLSDCQFKTEIPFLEFLIRNDWIQRQIGIKMFPTNGFFPDIKGEIYDDEGGLIKVEVEFRAENYTLHGHSFRGCDLILSFLRSPEVRFVKGIPVWSFYVHYRGDKIAHLSLYEDIDTDFDKIVEQENLRQYGRVCGICGADISHKHHLKKYCSQICTSIAIRNGKLLKKAEKLNLKTKNL